MKNAWLLLLSLSIILIVLPWGQRTDADQTGENYQVIPDEAIRLRILADSNAPEAQALKREVRDRVNAEITEWVEELTSIEAARQLIQDRLPELEAIVAQTLEDNGVEQTYHVDYGKNVTFPTKLYGPFIYPAGEYEAILITLGEGEGDNWWCVLFPPMCFLDFSDGTSVAAEEETPIEESEADQLEAIAEEETMKETTEEEKEVKFFVVEIWENIFS
ncbi:stage II sporulation protein R [Halobacillus sp. ACCC02827]|uniref:stage II sporulation protein R n=1 Tax=Bacillaceae TaxID=186817 RepID=UPI0002A4D772|nr:MULTISPECIES: stage II sporulation protein R [Bacillaceae]ELK49035.1 stage II sporulation protein R [Halobacillus sp. BAB-2008]QHT48171.1 stage II sporulation protein R [Bacillus sp. SB49]WJE15405.1 stage II sporulation protein R [Halobacillus sp. ACCC02827]